MDKSDISTEPKIAKLEMKIQPKIIDHLGINMYTAIHPVLSELVANAWDADSKDVFITIPEEKMSEKYFVIVRDEGSGMTYDELIDNYLQVGRNRREDNAKKKQEKRKLENKDKNEKELDEEFEKEKFIEYTPILNRKVLGRKGIGKLSVFGVAKKVIFKSIKNGKVTEFEMDVDDIKREDSGTYKPKPIRINESTTERNGVTITLKELNRKKAIDIDELRKGLARRFTILSENFRVHINNKPITLEDREYKDIQKTWTINESLPEHPEWKVQGKIYTRKATITEQEMRGISIFAGGKLVQEPTLFGASAAGKTFAYSHMLGELNAEFLDGKNDVISTNRSAINWESEEGQALEEWGYAKVKNYSSEWSEMRVELKRERFLKDKETQSWFDNLSKTK